MNIVRSVAERETLFGAAVPRSIDKELDRLIPLTIPRFTSAWTRVHPAMPNIGRSLRRAIRPLWIAGLGAAAWSNRAKVQQALGQKPATATAADESVTVRTTTATWTKPLRRRHRSTTVHTPSSAVPADMTSTFTEPTVIVPTTLNDSSTLSENL